MSSVNNNSNHSNSNSNPNSSDEECNEYQARYDRCVARFVPLCERCNQPNQYQWKDVYNAQCVCTKCCLKEPWFASNWGGAFEFHPEFRREVNRAGNRLDQVKYRSETMERVRAVFRDYLVEWQGMDETEQEKNRIRVMTSLLLDEMPESHLFAELVREFPFLYSVK